MNTKFFHNAKDNFQKPVVVIVGRGFIADFLGELFRLRNCQVIFVQKPSSLKKKVMRINYLFHLTGLEIPVRGIIQWLKMARKFDAKFLLAYSKKIDKKVENQIFQSHKKREIDGRIVYLNDVYGPTMNLKKKDGLTKLIKQATSGRSLTLSGNGLKKIYPTFVSDVIYGLVKVMFSSGTGGKVFYLLNPNKISLFDLAQELVRQSPKSLTLKTVSYKGRKKERYIFNWSVIKKNQATLGWKPKVEIKEGIEQTLAFFAKGKKKDKSLLKKKVIKEPLGEKIKRFFSQKVVVFFLMVSLFSLVLFYPLISLVFDGCWGLRNLQVAQQALVKVDFSRATKKAEIAQKSFRRANRKIQQVSFLFEFLGQEDSRKRLEKMLGVGDKVSQSLVYAGGSAQSVFKMGKIVFQDQSDQIKLDQLPSSKLASLKRVKEIRDLLENARVDLDFAYDQLSLAEAEAATVRNLLPVKLPFGEVRGLLLKGKEGLAIIPELIGLEGRKIYLVLLQNNMELRPTGGFIGSYALVIFSEGRLVDFQVEDVYTADGQLKGHVEPPPELKKYLGEAGWYLRDSNWSPDFPTSATRAAWFLEKETGRTVDGVVGINLFLAQRILAQIGGVEMVDFGEMITAENLFERAEYHSEVGFFPGSTQKKDFLASLTRILFEKTKTGEEKMWFALGKAAYNSLKEKDILIYLKNQKANEVITDLDWGGGIKNIKCQLHGEIIQNQKSDRNCLTDYLMVVEANVGVNKANYFLKRSLVHQVEINQSGVIQERLRIEYENQSQSEVFPSGRYKTYVRILVPLETKLEGVWVGKEKIEAEKIDEKEIGNKKSFGFLVTVPIKEKKEVEVVYQREEKVDLTKPFQYLMLVQKQSGIKDEAFNLWLSAPQGVFFTQAEPSAAHSGNTLVFNPDFKQDLVFDIELRQ